MAPHSRTSPITDRQDRPISRDMIKECAIALFEKHGVDETSVNDIVKIARIAKGTFYLYFTNKDDLINTVFEEYSVEFFKEVVIKNKDLLKITNLADSILSFCKKNPLFLRELRKNMTRHSDYPYYRKTMSEFSKLMLSFLNFDSRYPISQLEMYSEILISTVLEIIYRRIITNTINDDIEARLMIEDFMKRFFDCDKKMF